MMNLIAGRGLPEGLAKMLGGALGSQIEDAYTSILDDVMQRVNKRIDSGELVLHFTTQRSSEGVEPTQARLTNIRFENHHIVVLEGVDDDGCVARGQAFFRGDKYTCECDEKTAAKVEGIQFTDMPCDVQVMIDEALDARDSDKKAENRAGLLKYLAEAREIVRDDREIKIGKVYHILDNDNKPEENEIILVTKHATCEKSGIRMVGGIVVETDGFKPALVPLWRLGEEFVE
jgi:hypothetical protein